MQKLKKPLSIILSVIMILSLFTVVPFSAGAQVSVSAWSQIQSEFNQGNSVQLDADITAAAADSFLDVKSNTDVTLDLNGHELSRGEISDTSSGYVIRIEQGGKLTVTDSKNGIGSVSGGSSEYGGAFYNKGTLDIQSGTVKNNTSKNGGGAVYNEGIFNMSGGCLYKNTSADGGAIYNAAAGDVNLSGTAKISENETTEHGGGAITNYGQMKIQDDPEISNNTAFTRGGGIWNGKNSTLLLYGGIITENTANIAGNGIYYYGGTLCMSGSPVVNRNGYDDLFICQGNKISITGKLVPTESPGGFQNIGITVTGTSSVITTDLSRYNPDMTSPFDFFFNYDQYELAIQNGELITTATKITYTDRWWDDENNKVMRGNGLIDNAIDVSTLSDDVSVGMHSNNWYIVRRNVTITHRLNVVGTANLILCDGATLTCSDGIRCERELNSVLNVYSQAEESGKLIARTETRDWAAIGGHASGDAGTLNLYSGNIEAYGLRSGIAGGTSPDKHGGAGGPVHIYGGTLKAVVTGDSASGAAIGGGNKNYACWKSGEGIVIYGGTVTATAHYGAGIGNGSGEISYSSPGSIAIYGGKVYAKGETGIGGGNNNGAPRIDIYGGDVTAIGNNGRTAGSGMGGGFNANQGGSINIHGGSVLAVGSSGAGIGGGYHGNGGTVNISGGIVVANASCRGAGIGGGNSGKGGTVNISGGIVHATSTTYDRTGELYNDVEKFFTGFIKTGTTKGMVDNYTNAAALAIILGITAIVDYTRDNNVVGAGIGGGYDADGGTVNITGGIVLARTGLSEAAAIGKGKSGDSNGNVSVPFDHMVMTGSSENSLTRVSESSRILFCRSMCVQISPCDHYKATYETDDDHHLTECRWCGKDYWEFHDFDDSELKCRVCGYERVLVEFYPESGSGTMDPVYVRKGADYNLPYCRFTPPQGKIFIGWSLNDSSEIIPPNMSINVDRSCVIKANWSDNYGLSIGDVTVAENNKDDILGDGKASFDPGSCILTLNEAVIPNISAENMTLTVKGSAIIGNTNGNGINVHLGSLTLDGNFSIHASNTGIKADGTGSKNGRIIIAKGNIEISSTFHSIQSERGLYINNEVEYLEVTSTSENISNTIVAYNTQGEFIIEEELYIREPENATVSGEFISGNPKHVIIEPKYVTVSFDSDGAEDTGEYAMEPITGKQSNVIDLPECAFKTPDLKLFAGWLLDDTRYMPGDSYTLTKDVTFNALWKNESCTLTFHSNIGDDESYSVTVPYGSDFILPENTFDFPDDLGLVYRWSEDPVNDSKIHRFGAVITVEDDMDFYGVYSQNHTHTLKKYDAVDATCEQRGNIEYWQCMFCNKCFTDEGGIHKIRYEDTVIPAFGHSPDDPVIENMIPATPEEVGSYDSVVYCSTCGKELSRDINAIPFGGKFKGHSLSLNGDIGVNFYLDLTEQDISEGATVNFSWTVDGTKKTRSVTLSSGNITPCGYKASCPVAVAEMTYNVTATLTIGSISVETDTYSAKQYANVILTDNDFRTKYIAEKGETKYDQLVTLVKTLLDYSSKAQIRFDRNTGDLANGGTDFFSGEVTIPDSSSDMSENLSAVGLEYAGTSVLYLSETTLRHYYRINHSELFTDEIKSGITFNGETVTYKEKNGMIYFDKVNIAAPQLDTEYVLKIGNHEYQYSVLDYSCLAYNSDDKPYSESIAKQLAASIYRYNQAADIYFAD